MNKETVLIEPFQIPLDLEKQNITGQALVNKLLDQIEIIKEKADTSYNNIDFKPVFFDSQLEIVIPGSGISLKSLLQNFKNFLGKKQTRISGEVVLINGKINLTIRVLGEPSKTYTGEISELDDILKDAAQYVLIYTQPYLLAYYLYYNYDNNKDEALEMIRFTLTHEPKDDDAMAYTLDGSIKYDEKKYEESIRLYKKAIETDPKFIDAYNGLAFSLFELKKYDEAVDIYKKAIEINPDNAYTYDYWAILLEEQGNIKEAFNLYEKSIQLDPNNTEFLLDYGKALLKVKNYDKALEMFDKVIETDLKNSDGYMEKGNIFYEKGDLEESLSNYNKAIDLNNKSFNAYIGAAKILKDKKNYTEAEDMLKKAGELNPKSYLSFFALGNLLAEQNKLQEASLMFKKSLDLDSAVSDTYKNLGELFDEQGKTEDAKLLYEKAIRQKFTDSVYFENKMKGAENNK